MTKHIYKRRDFTGTRTSTPCIHMVAVVAEKNPDENVYSYCPDKQILERPGVMKIYVENGVEFWGYM